MVLELEEERTLLVRRSALKAVRICSSEQKFTGSSILRYWLSAGKQYQAYSKHVRYAYEDMSHRT